VNEVNRHPAEGLCARCVHAERIESAKGSTFVLCALSRENPAFKKYPPLPVRACAGFEQLIIKATGDT
jgi:hypothetical protein